MSVWVRETGWQTDWKFVYVCQWLLSSESCRRLASLFPPLPAAASGKGRGRKLSGSECSQWAGRSDSCCAVTEEGWLLESSQVKLQDEPIAAGTTRCNWKYLTLSLLWYWWHKGSFSFSYSIWLVSRQICQVFCSDSRSVRKKVWQL